MKKKQILLVAFVLFGLMAQHCTKQAIQPYQGGHYVQFTTGVVDTVSFSFFFHPGKDEVKVGLPVRLIGDMPTQDLEYTIEVVNEGTTATAAEYVLEGPFRFRPGLQQDTAYVTFKNHSGLQQQEVVLSLQIKDSQTVLAGQTAFAKRVFKISDRVSKPVWWDANMDRFYLGVYSESKFRAFMQATGVGDLLPYSDGERRILMMEFKYYLIDMKDKGTPLLLEDGSDMLASVPLIG